MQLNIWADQVRDGIDQSWIGHQPAKRRALELDIVTMQQFGRRLIR